jgi:hypothetical protein
MNDFAMELFAFLSGCNYYATQVGNQRYGRLGGLRYGHVGLFGFANQWHLTHH